MEPFHGSCRAKSGTNPNPVVPLLVYHGGVHVISGTRLGHGSHRGRKMGLGFVLPNMILGRPKVKYNVPEQGREKMFKSKDPYGEGKADSALTEKQAN